MIALALPIYPESFLAIAVTVFPYCCSGNKYRNNVTNESLLRYLLPLQQHGKTVTAIAKKLSGYIGSASGIMLILLCSCHLLNYNSNLCYL